MQDVLYIQNRSTPASKVTTNLLRVEMGGKERVSLPEGACWTGGGEQSTLNWGEMKSGRRGE